MKKKVHKILSLMFDPRFKILCFVSSLIGREQDKAIVEEYDKKKLFSIFLKCYYHLHLLFESKMGVIDQRVEEDMNLNIFKMTTSTNEPTMELVNKELLIFRHYQMVVKDIKYPSTLQWWKNMRACFLQLVFMLKKY